LWEEVQVKEAEKRSQALSELYRLEEAHTRMGQTRRLGQGSGRVESLKTRLAAPEEGQRKEASFHLGSQVTSA